LLYELFADAKTQACTLVVETLVLAESREVVEELFDVSL